MLTALSLLETLEPVDTSQALSGEGSSADSSAKWHVVGKPNANLQGSDQSGAVEIYSANSNSHYATILNPEPAVLDLFGNAVAVDGDILVAAAQRDGIATGDVFSGSVYVYDLSGDSPQLISTIRNPLPAAASEKGQEFGNAVDIDGATIIGPDGGADGVVGLPDFLALAQLFGKSSSDTGFRAELDFSSDGVIGLPDFLQLVSRFGQSV